MGVKDVYGDPGGFNSTALDIEKKISIIFKLDMNK